MIMMNRMIMLMMIMFLCLSHGILTLFTFSMVSYEHIDHYDHDDHDVHAHDDHVRLSFAWNPYSFTFSMVFI